MQYLTGRKGLHKECRRPWGTCPPDLFLGSAKSCPSTRRRLWLRTNRTSSVLWTAPFGPPMSLHTTGHHVFSLSNSSVLQSSSPETPLLPPGASGTLAFILGPSPEVLTTARRHRGNSRTLEHSQALCVFREPFHTDPRDRSLPVWLLASDTASLLSSHAQQLPLLCSAQASSCCRHHGRCGGSVLICNQAQPRLPSLETGLLTYLPFPVSTLFLFWIFSHLVLGLIYLSKLKLMRGIDLQYIREKKKAAGTL